MKKLVGIERGSFKNDNGELISWGKLHVIDLENYKGVCGNKVTTYKIGKSIIDYLDGIENQESLIGKTIEVNFNEYQKVKSIEFGS